MKLNVQGIEEIEITDPAGLCALPRPGTAPAPVGQPTPMPQLPPGIQPRPSYPGLPTPINPFIPGIATPPNYTRRIGDPDELTTKWEIGGNAIQKARQQVDPEKWEQNWNSKAGEPDPEFERGDPDGV